VPYHGTWWRLLRLHGGEHAFTVLDQNTDTNPIGYEQHDH